MTKVNQWKWNFTEEEKENVQAYNQAIRNRILALREANKPYTVIVQEFPAQLVGIHKLFSIIATEFSKEAGRIVSLETVKNLVKEEYGFLESFYLGNDVNVKQYRSFKDCTFEEMQSIIEFTQSWALTEWGIKDCVLTSAENRAMIEYYNKKD